MPWTPVNAISPAPPQTFQANFYQTTITNIHVGDRSVGDRFRVVCNFEPETVTGRYQFNPVNLNNLEVLSVSTDAFNNTATVDFIVANGSLGISGVQFTFGLSEIAANFRLNMINQ